jgi:hypothetical protein
MLEAKIRAYNSNGNGGYSSLNTVGDLLKGPPTFMYPPLKDNALSTEDTLYLYWDPISIASHTGSSPITSYALFYLVGATWTELKGDSSDDLDLFYTVTGLT